MQIKKVALIGTAIAMITLPIISKADSLNTTNNTDFDSAVLITSGSHTGKCTGTLPWPFTSYTAAHSTSSTGWGAVAQLCKGSGGTCTATIYMSKDCSVRPIATASLSLGSHTITTEPLAGATIKATASGSSLLLS